jgi:hypothetical protein
LLVALALVTVGRGSLGAPGSTIAAIFWLTTLERQRSRSRDRCDQRSVFGACAHFLADVLAARSISVADFHRHVDFSRSRLSEKRSRAPAFLLFHLDCSGLANWPAPKRLHPAHFVGIRFNKIENSLERETARGLVWGSVVLFVVVLLFPGSVPRYVLPPVAPFVLADWPRREEQRF